MDTPTPPDGFVVGSWPRAMLVIPVPEHYTFRAPSDTDFTMYPATIVGPHSFPIVSFNDGLRNRGFSIEFTEAGAYQVLGVDQSELTNRMIPAEELLPRDMVERIVDTVRRTTDPASICEEVQAVLLRYLRGHVLYDIPPAFGLAFAHICQHPDTSVEALARELNMTPRHLRRMFSRTVGMSPKRVSLLLRTHNVARRIIVNEAAGRTVSLTDIAHEFGFHDQAHLAHVLQRELLVSPSKLPGSNQHGEVRVVLRPSTNYKP